MLTALVLLSLSASLQPDMAQVRHQDTHWPIVCGWADELDTPSGWAPLEVENKAHVYQPYRGSVLLGLDHVPSNWPYAYQWSGVTRDVTVDTGRYPVLLARVLWVQGYAHMDIDVLDSQGKPVKTLRTTTLNGPGLSELDFDPSDDPIPQALRLRLIVGGPNEGCSATYDWVRFVRKADAERLKSHPDLAVTDRQSVDR